MIARAAGIACLGAATIATAAPSAQAHLVSTELGPFYDGAAHPLVTPEDAMTIAAIAILGGFGAIATARHQFVAIAAGWAAGVAAGFGLSMPTIAAPFLSAAVLLALGVLGLARARVPAMVLVPTAALLGAGRGIVNGAEARIADGTWLTVIGIASGVFAVACVIAAVAVHVERRGAGIALRVAASWIAAAALLMLGWELRQGLP